MSKVSYHQATAAPTTKVSAATAAAAVVFVISWAVNEYTGVDIPLHVQGFIATIFVFVAGYFTPNRMHGEDLDVLESSDRIDPHGDEDLLPEKERF